MELIRKAGETVVPFLLRITNKVLMEGKQPDEWGKQIFCSIWKEEIKEIKEYGDNQRGLAFMSHSC